MNERKPGGTQVPPTWLAGVEATPRAWKQRRGRAWTGVDGRGRAVQHGCVEGNSCVPVNLVLLLLLCLLSRGIRMVEDYERLFP